MKLQWITSIVLKTGLESDDLFSIAYQKPLVVKKTVDLINHLIVDLS